MKKALTIKNPWADLIAADIKDVENRSRRTHYRGTVLIHSSKQIDSRWPNPFTLFTPEQIQAIPSEKISRIVHANDLKFSSIIGQVDIVDCIQDSKSIWAIPGQWHWVLKNAIMYAKPVPNVKGQLGLWNYKGELDYFVIDSWGQIGGRENFF